MCQCLDHIARVVTYTATLRYDINGKSDLKIQFDHVIERSETPFMGSAKAIAIAYDVVF